MSPQSEFGFGGVISSAATCFPSYRSLFTVMYFIASFKYVHEVSFPVKTRSSMPTGSERFSIIETVRATRGKQEVFH